MREISGLQSSTDVIPVKNQRSQQFSAFQRANGGSCYSGRGKENSIDNHIIKGFSHSYLVYSVMPNVVLADSGLISCVLIC